MDKNKEIQEVLQEFADGKKTLSEASEAIIEIHMRVEIALKTRVEETDECYYID